VPRHFVLQVRKVSYCPTSPYLVHVPHSLQNVEGAKRRFFSKEAVAKTYVKRLSHLLGNYQLQALEDYRMRRSGKPRNASLGWADITVPCGARSTSIFNIWRKRTAHFPWEPWWTSPWSLRSRTR
jgi:hypothetical protein